MRKFNFLGTLLLAAAAVVSLAAPAFCVEQKVVQEGGPYVCDGPGKLERFSGKIAIAKDEANMPIWFTMYNGYGGRPGFTWARVFLAPPGQVGAQTGQILADERTFLRKNAVTIDLSGCLSAEGNEINVEGEGPRGATFSWVLSTVKEDFSVIDSTPVIAGKTCFIHGVGFSTNKDENNVMIDGKKAEILSASSRILSVKVPDDVSGTGSVPLTVSVGDKTSAPIRAAIGALPPRLLSISPLGGPVGGQLNIRGTNFSKVPSENVVTIGPYNAPVLQVLNDGELLVEIPNWGSSGYTLPVRVTSRGIPSSNTLQFWCTPHYYGGDPNAAVYQYD